MRGHGKSEANIHAAGKMFDRRIQKFFDLGEGDDFIELLFDFEPRHAQDGSVEKNVFPSGQFRMKPGSYFQQAGHPALHFDPAGCRLGDPAEDFEERRFARAVASNDADDVSALDLERDVLERPELLVTGIGRIFSLQGAKRSPGGIDQDIAESLVLEATAPLAPPV